MKAIRCQLKGQFGRYERFGVDLGEETKERLSRDGKGREGGGWRRIGRSECGDGRRKEGNKVKGVRVRDILATDSYVMRGEGS